MLIALKRDQDNEQSEVGPLPKSKDPRWTQRSSLAVSSPSRGCLNAALKKSINPSNVRSQFMSAWMMVRYGVFPELTSALTCQITYRLTSSVSDATGLLVPAFAAFASTSPCLFIVVPD